MDKVVIARKAPFVNNLIFLNGIGRAGKFFMGKIISGFVQTEYFQYISLLEHLPYLERLGCITRDAAVSLLQVNVDEHAYNMRIGRNLNLRFDDASAILNSYEADLYLKRALLPISGKISEDVNTQKRYSAFVLHDSLPNIKIFFTAFPRLKWVNLIRHPIDLIHSWYLKGWGHRLATDPLSFIPVMKGADCSVPWYAFEWKKEYESMSEIDRIIKSIAVLIEKGKESYLVLSEREKKQIIFITYESLVENTNEIIRRLGSFLNIKPSPRMAAILIREKCPRKIELKERKKKARNIKSKASKKMFGLMMHLASGYEKSKTV